MTIDIASLSPRDFFHLLRSNIFSDDVQIFLGEMQKWKDISIDSFDFSMNPSNMEQYGVVSGNMHFSEELVGVPLGPTVAKI